MERTTTHTYTDGSEDAVGGGKQPAWLLKSVTDPGGAVTSYAYTSGGDLAEETDAAGLVTRYGYDGIGRATSETVVSSTHPDGATTTVAYDGMSRIRERLEPVVTNAVSGKQHQQRTVNTYNVDGTLASTTVSDAKGNDPARTTTYGYDSRGRQNKVTDPEGGVVTVSYDDFGDVVKRTDAAGTVYRYTYTPRQRELATTTVEGFTGDGGSARDVVLESRAYDPAGRLASVTDAMGITTSFTYYNEGLVAAEYLEDYQDPDTGQTRRLLLASFDYTGNGEVSVATKGEGRYSTTTSYDPGGRPISTTDRDGSTVLRSTVTEFDALDNPVKVTDKHADGSVASISEASHDEMGREVSLTEHVSDGTAALTTISRDERGLPIAVTDPRGNAAGANPTQFTTEFGYDALGQQVSVTAPPMTAESGGEAGATTRSVTATGYNTFGEQTHSRDAAGNVTRTSYDRAGRATSVRLPDYTPPGAAEAIGATISTSYDPAGRVVSETDRGGNKTLFSYDELGNLRSVTDPPQKEGQSEGVTEATYTPNGLRLSLADPMGAQTHWTYDQLGRPLTQSVVERSPAPERILTTTYRYDALGNPASVATPGGRTTTFEHDDLGNPTKMVSPAGVVTTAKYDSQGRTVRVVDPTQATSKFSYDMAGRNTSIAEVDAQGETLRVRSFDYDLAGNQVVAVDPLGAKTTQSFDALGQLTEITRQVSADKSITTSYGYDVARNLTRASDGNGNATVFTYNSWGLPESTIEPATAQTPERADRTYRLSYDVFGRVSEESKPGGVRITNTYDALGNLVAQTGTGAKRATPDRRFGYDKVGRMTSVSAPGADNEFAYDDRGNLLTASGPSGDTTFVWDGDGKLTSATTGAGKAEFGYDAAGRLATASDPLSGASASYSYDVASRVASVAYGGAKRSLGYDVFGRLASDTITAPDGSVAARVGYGYDKADQLTEKATVGVAGAAVNSYGYDDAGRLTSWNDGESTTSYGWDDAGNLVERGGLSASFNERNQLLTHDDSSFTYTPRGTLASRSADGVTTAVEFNAFDELVVDGATEYGYDGLGRLLSAGDAELAYVGSTQDVAADGGRFYSYAPDGMMLGVGQPGEGEVAWTDTHTDLVATFDPASGVLGSSRTFDPFGVVSAAEGVEPSLGYQHQFTDPETGNVNMGARWYQPGTGTFASRDAAVLDPRDVGNANRYAYAGGSPLLQIDPEGYFFRKVWNGVKKTARAAVRVAKEVSGYNDLRKCVGGSWGACGWFVAGLTPVGKIAKGVKLGAKALGGAAKSSRAGRAASSSRAGRAYTSTRAVVGKAAGKARGKVVKFKGSVGRAGSGVVHYAARSGVSRVVAGGACRARRRTSLFRSPRSTSGRRLGNWCST